MSKAQVDRLGDRLRAGNPGEEDLRELAKYRTGFEPAYDAVFEAVLGKLRLVPTGRPAKSTRAIIDKLTRESIRLSQIQDIAGLRVVVPDCRAQDDAIQELFALYPEGTLVDRRVFPSHGYRAVHMIVRVEGLPVEIQIRTMLQHLWAELSEKLADLRGPEVKYGGGPPRTRELLDGLSEHIASSEEEGEGAPDLARELDDLLRGFHAIFGRS